MSSPSNPTPLVGISVAELLPSQVELRDVALSFSLPKGKNLSQTLARELRTEYDSYVCLRVKPDCLEITCNPPILIDAQWPAQNMQFTSAVLRFANTAVEVTVSNIHGAAQGFVDFTSTARKEISSLLMQGISGTAMATHGYNPLTDSEVLGTLEAIKKNFESAPSSGQSDVSTADIGNVSVEATVAMRTAFTYSKDGSGMSLPAGSTLKVRIAGAGNLARIASAQTTQDRIDAANLQSITLTSDALTLLYGGHPVTQLLRVRVDRGGTVQVEKLRLMGSLEEAADMESLVRMLAGAAALAGQGVSGEAALRLAAGSPKAEAELVPGLTRMKLESILTEGIQKLVKDNAGAIPGIDLQRILIA